MKTFWIAFLLAYYLSALITGCAMFQKTAKTNNMAKQLSTTQLESAQLVLKHVGKETQIVTYWSDSGTYQYQHIKEELNQAKSERLIAEEKDKFEKQINTKMVEPVNKLVYGFIFFAAVVGLMLFFKSK